MRAAGLLSVVPFGVMVLSLMIRASRRRGDRDALGRPGRVARGATTGRRMAL
jgi:hypothetical protein